MSTAREYHELLEKRWREAQARLAGRKEEVRANIKANLDRNKALSEERRAAQVEELVAQAFSEPPEPPTEREIQDLMTLAGMDWPEVGGADAGQQPGSAGRARK
jgi:hypothetical protein